MVSLFKLFKWCITLPLLAWSIFWSMAAGGQISTHVQIMVTEVKKNAKRILYIFELLNYKKQSKYCFRQLVHTELQYRIFAPALLPTKTRMHLLFSEEVGRGRINNVLFLCFAWFFPPEPAIFFASTWPKRSVQKN